MTANSKRPIGSAQNKLGSLKRQLKDRLSPEAPARSPIIPMQSAGFSGEVTADCR